MSVPHGMTAQEFSRMGVEARLRKGARKAARQVNYKAVKVAAVMRAYAMWHQAMLDAGMNLPAVHRKLDQPTETLRGGQKKRKPSHKGSYERQSDTASQASSPAMGVGPGAEQDAAGEAAEVERGGDKARPVANTQGYPPRPAGYFTRAASKELNAVLSKMPHSAELFLPAISSKEIWDELEAGFAVEQSWRERLDVYERGMRRYARLYEERGELDKAFAVMSILHGRIKDIYLGRGKGGIKALTEEEAVMEAEVVGMSDEELAAAMGGEEKEKK